MDLLINYYYYYYYYYCYYYYYNLDDSEEKRPLSRQFAMNLKNVRPTFFNINQMQSVSVLSICVHPHFSFLLLYFFCCSTDLSGYCNVSFYSLGILGVMKQTIFVFSVLDWNYM